MWGRRIFTKVPCLFHFPACTWAETKLEVLLTCLWFGSQLGITFPAPQANPRILLAKYYWCPGTTSQKTIYNTCMPVYLGAQSNTGDRTSSKKSLCPLFLPLSFLRSGAWSLINTIHIQKILQPWIGDIKERQHSGVSNMPILANFFLAHKWGEEKEMIMYLWITGIFPSCTIIMMSIDTNFCFRATYWIPQRDAIHIEHTMSSTPSPEVCNKAVSIEYFPYSRHQNDFHAVSHFIIMTNHVVGIGTFLLQLRKPMDNESLNDLLAVTQLVNCRSRIQTSGYLSPALMLLTISLS